MAGAAGFDTAPASAPETNLVAPTSVGAFGAATDMPRPGTDGPMGSVVDAGFGVGAAPNSSAARPRAVVDAGFGSKVDGESARAETPSRKEVRSGSFDILPAHVPQRGARPGSGAVEQPVEILFKPTPAYTDEARALKLEGDVILEVEFSASQGILVLRVVRGLGHGLNEAAARAAELIRFKPAQSGGKPVDFRATLHIVFRLT